MSTKKLTKRLMKEISAGATAQARREWTQLAEYAAANGHAEDAQRMAPPADADHQIIDIRICALAAAVGLKLSLAAGALLALMLRLGACG